MSKRKAVKKATKKPAKKKAAAKPPAKPPVPEVPLWGDSLKVGSVANREFLVREPLNQAAVDTMNDEQVQALVLAVLLRRLEVDMSEVKRLLGALKGWAGNEALIAGG